MLIRKRIPTAWKNAKMMLIFKNGNKKDLKNYRPICLLLNIYKVLTKVLTKRLEKTLDENQPREQAGFRSGYSSTDHIHPRRKATEGDVQRIYPTLHRIRRLREILRLCSNSSRTDLASRTGDRRCGYSFKVFNCNRELIPDS